MKLESLHISRNTYAFDFQGVKAGGIGGTIKFSGTAGSTVEVVLKESHIKQILAVVAESMTAHTRELATELTAEVIEHAGLPALSHEAA